MKADLVTQRNAIAIKMFRRNKRDQAKTISVSYIQKAIDATKAISGDLFHKAAILVLELTRIHAFESGNKRIAFLTTKKFVITNGKRFRIPDIEHNVKIMIGIRENYYTQKEIKEWIKHGKIKAFKR